MQGFKNTRPFASQSPRELYIMSSLGKGSGKQQNESFKLSGENWEAPGMAAETRDPRNCSSHIIPMLRAKRAS